MALPLVAMISVLLARLFTFEMAKYLAMRALLIALMLGLGPIVILKAFVWIAQHGMTLTMMVFNQLMAGMEIPDAQAMVINLFGVGAYLGSYMKIAEGLSIYMSFLLLRFVWGMVFRPLHFFKMW